uniref:C2H2-type domain-containing protein n=1 Tax=Romanomermis culicivorax TaxID=13658 RepID=A0A915JJP8_ROMCU
CEKVFHQKFYLEQHIDAEHKGVRYRCQQFTGLFTLKKNLLRHHTKQHSLTGCLYCNGNFMDQKSLLAKKHCQQCLAVKPDQNIPIELEEKSEDYGQPIQEENYLSPDMAEYPEDAQQQMKDYWSLIRTKKS